MATQAYSREPSAETNGRMWGSALVAGLIGGVGMGLLMQDAMPAVASLYGQEGALAGWIAHLFHSAIFALIFAAVVTRGALRPYADTLAKVVGLGAVYGVVLTVVGPGVLMPIWMNAVNPAANAPLFAIGAMSFVTHLVYGLLLGAVFVLARRTGTPGSDESATEGDELRADLAETE